MDHYGLTPSRLSHMAGHDHSLLLRFFKRPQGKLNAAILERVARTLHCTVAYLRGDSDEITLQPTFETPRSVLERPSEVLGFTIRFYREKAGLSRKQISDEFSVTRAAVHSWEGGINTPPLDKLRMLSKMFGLPEHTLESKEIDPEVQRALEFERIRVARRTSIQTAPAPLQPVSTSESQRVEFASVGDQVRIDVQATLPFEAAMEVIALVRKHMASVSRPADP
jgi:transcriptional regulator with XRE-family HTH domain